MFIVCVPSSPGSVLLELPRDTIRHTGVMYMRVSVQERHKKRKRKKNKKHVRATLQNICLSVTDRTGLIKKAV